MARKYMNYGDLTELFCKHKREHPYEKLLTGCVIITQDSFAKVYSEASRIYRFSSLNKAFMPNMGGLDSLDGSDKGVRLKAYLAAEKGGKDSWQIEKCWIEKCWIEEG